MSDKNENSMCNMCGKQLHILEGLNTEVKAMYGSKYDGSLIKFHLCAKCFDLFIDDFLLKNCVKKPVISED